MSMYWRVNHGYEANEAQILSGEVHLITVKVKTLRELLIRQIEMAEAYKVERKCKKKQTTVTNE